ncbi:MAG: glucose-1-phosphate cytidylyltransferase [Candidatus Adiutrix sp.]|jgi:glucose-1-phosphate cytidylyltransferase|nr:glucose-1-phosphate cytidylyltransferase [Candidatus Adiutrix sp.]
MQVVILAGGLGTRISEESHLRPKPLLEIGGQPILWHIMKYYSHFNFNDFVICCGYRGYMIKEYFADYYLHRSDVTFDFRSGGRMEVHSNVAEPWRVTLIDTGYGTATGGRVKRVEPFINKETFMLTYGDGLSNVDLKALVAHHKAVGKKVTMTAVRPGGRYGVLSFAEDQKTVTGFQEKPKGDGGWINAGFMVMEPSVFRYIDGDNCSLEARALTAIGSEMDLDAFKHEGFWQCMDTQRDKEQLERLWDRGAAPWKVWDY